jgi:ATP-dependent exoDNAse (exonuclease V) beta subunit
VCERGLPIDSVLAITYTERAAGELRSRIRSRLAELDRHDLSRQLDGAWISTIHGFCHRLLKAHPFEAAVDPNFRVLDENQARVLAGEAFGLARSRTLRRTIPSAFALRGHVRGAGLSAECVDARLRGSARPGGRSCSR